MIKFKDISIKNKMITVFSTLILISVTLLGSLTYLSTTKKVEKMLGQRLEHILRTSVLMIDYKDHERLSDMLALGFNDLSNNPSFKKINSTLRDIKKNNELENDIYTVIAPEWNESDSMIFVATSAEKTYAGNQLPLNPLVAQVIKDGKFAHSSLYEDHEGTWLSAFAPIKDEEGRVVAVLEADFDARNEVRDVKIKLLKFILIPTIIVLFLGIIVGTITGNRMSAPITLLSEAAGKMAEGNFDIDVPENSKDEIGTLGKSFNKMTREIKASRAKIEDYAQNLERKVEERTKLLDEAKQNTENILNNLGQGFMVFSESGIIEPGSSKASEEYFGVDPTGKTFAEVLQLDEAASTGLQGWYDVIFSDAVMTMGFESLVDIGPKSFTKDDGRFIQLEYRPLFDDSEEALKKIICIASDKTEEKKLKEIAEKETALVKMVMSFMESRGDFIDFIFESRRVFIEIQEELKKQVSEINIDTMFRGMHSVKGMCSTFHFLQVSKLAHGFETELANLKEQSRDMFESYLPSLKKGIEELIVAFEGHIETHRDIFGDLDQDNQEKSVSTSNILDMTKLLEKKLGHNSSVYKKFVKDFVLEDFSESFKKFEKLVNQIADKQGKEIKFSLEESKILVYQEQYKPLLSAFVHVFRNAVDHGIEDPFERMEKGKEDQAEIKINFKELPLEENRKTKYMLIKVTDNGKGINPEIIKTKAIEKGILTEDKAESYSDKDIRQLIFHPGFSTNTEVTDLSGRGVGLDALKYEVKKLGGVVYVDSEIDKGSKFILKIPIFEKPSFKPVLAS